MNEVPLSLNGPFASSFTQEGYWRQSEEGPQFITWEQHQNPTEGTDNLHLRQIPGGEWVAIERDKLTLPPPDGQPYETRENNVWGFRFPDDSFLADPEGILVEAFFGSTNNS